MLRVHAITAGSQRRPRRPSTTNRDVYARGFAMLIIYGSRWCGQVDTQEGQCQLTRFAHIYWLPILPIGTMWATSQVDKSYQGHKVRWSWRSVLAGYARFWGPVVALFGIARLSLDGALVATIAASLCAWSWTWYGVRGAREQRRSDHHAAAYGTRCDPLRMPRQLAFSLRTEVDRAWAAASGGRTPEDVARLGANDPAEAALAYATMRLVARTAVGPAAQVARATSEKLLDATASVTVAEGSPYRATPVAAPVTPAAPRRSDSIIEGTRLEG